MRLRQRRVADVFCRISDRVPDTRYALDAVIATRDISRSSVSRRNTNDRHIDPRCRPSYFPNNARFRTLTYAIWRARRSIQTARYIPLSNTFNFTLIAIHRFL